jgi:hypothetical protein
MEILASDSFTNFGTVSYKQFCRECSGYELASALRLIQYESASMGMQILKKLEIRNSFLGSGVVYVSQEAHAFIAKQLILHSGYLQRRILQKSDYEKLIVYFNHLETDLNYLDPKDTESQKWLVRASYSQSRYQRILNHVLGRYQILFHDLGYDSQICGNMVKQAMGLDVLEIMLIGLSFYATIYLNKQLDIRCVEEHTIQAFNDVLRPDKLKLFLNALSISQGKFTKDYSYWRWNNILLKKYEFNPLWQYPIIDTRLQSPNLRYIVPSLDDLVYRFTEGIYYATMDFYRKSGLENEFSTKFGTAFEKYVGFHLQDVKTENLNLGVVQPEMEYTTNHNQWKSADWLLVTQSSVIQVECKKNTTPLKFRAAVSDGDSSDFDTVLDTFSKYVIKSYKKAQHISENKLNLPNTQKTPSVFSLFVVMDDFYHIDSHFKRIITTKAAKDIPDIEECFRYHILSISDFELLCEFLKSRKDVRLEDLLKLKNAEENYYKDFAQFLGQSYTFSCFQIKPLVAAADKVWSLANEQNIN